MATLESRDDQGENSPIYETPAIIGEVDPGFRIGGSEPHHAKEETGVVREQRVPRHLCEQAHHRGDEDTTTHTSCSNHIHPGLLSVFQLYLDGRPDLCHFRLY